MKNVQKKIITNVACVTGAMLGIVAVGKAGKKAIGYLKRREDDAIGIDVLEPTVGEYEFTEEESE